MVANFRAATTARQERATPDGSKGAARGLKSGKQENQQAHRGPKTDKDSKKHKKATKNRQKSTKSPSVPSLAGSAGHEPTALARRTTTNVGEKVRKP